MSIEIMTRAWATPCSNSSTKLVLMALADNANSSGLCWPSIATVAEKCDLSEQGVRNQIKFLQELGYVAVKQGGGRFANCYTITLPPLHGVDPTPQRGGGVPPTALTPPLHGVDPNHHVTVNEPPLQGGADDFVKFWAAYPRKVGKPAAAKAFHKAVRKVTVAALIAAVETHKRSAQWIKDGGQFIPHPATWLNGERWADEVKAPGQPAAPAQDPDVLVIGFFRLTKDTPPRREQFETQGTYETYLSAWRKHFKQYE